MPVKPPILSFCALLAIASPSLADAGAPWLAGYRYRVPVTVENTSGVAQPAMPVDLRFDSMAQILLKKLRPDGGDLKVTDGSGREVPRYIEGLQDDSAPARIWVRGAAEPAGGKQAFYLYYGNPTAAPPTTDPLKSLFSDPGTEDPGAEINLDFEKQPTANEPIEGTAVTLPRDAPGYHGRGAWFDGQSAGLPLKVADPGRLGQCFTISFWMKMLPHPIAAPQALVDIDGIFQILEGEVRAYASKGATDLTYKTPYHQWTHVAVSFDGEKLVVFVNGKEAARGPVKGSLSFERGNLLLGYEPTGGGRWFTPMVMDDFALTLRPVTGFPGIPQPPAVTVGAEEVNPANTIPVDTAAPHVYLPLEAENFDGVVNDRMYDTLKVAGKPQWFLSHDQPFLSRGYGIFTITQGATASKNVNIPKAGQYRLWVRYAPTGQQEYLMGRYTGSAFQVKVSQNGTDQEHEFGRTLDYDPRQARWESTDVTLGTGVATLTLTKNIENPNAAEKIDFLLLTDDPDYVPDYRHFGMLWLRFKMLDVQGPGPYRAIIRVLRHDGNPWFNTVDFKPGDYLFTTGKDSGWIDGLQFVAGASDATFTLSFRDENNKAPASGKVELDYARLPYDSAIYKRAISTSTRSFGFSVLGPMGDLSNLDSWSDSVENISRRHLDQALARKWPVDNTPTNITISATTSIGGYSDEVVRNELSTLKAMGVNRVNSDYDGWGDRAATDIATKELGFNQTSFTFFLDLGLDHRLKISPFTDRFWTPIQDLLDQRVKALRDRSGEEEIKRITWVALNDEVVGWLPPSTLLKQPESLAAFKKWLDDQQATPASFGLTSWANLEIVQSRDTATTPNQKRLWMYEMDFSTEVSTLVYKRTSEMVAKALGHPVDTTINPSPHQYMFRGFASPNGDGLNYPRFWQQGGTTLPWTEDWSGDNGMLFVSNEMAAYITEIARAGADHSRPTGLYVTSGTGESRRQKAIAALAHGAKHIDHYTYGPRFANTEGSWSHLPEVFNVIGDIDSEIARADDLLGPAKPRRGQVAILYPWSTDVWKTNGASIAERFYLFLALAHARQPVDILSEEQVTRGVLAGYKVLYVADDNVRRSAVRGIAKWVNAGGTLVSLLSAGSKDEFDAPSASFDSLLGLNLRTVSADADSLKTDFQRNGVPQLKPMGQMTFSSPLPAGPVEAYGLKATAEIKTARVIGTWPDGSAAATINDSGAGKAIFIGALPGVSYVRGSNMGPGFTTEYPGAVRDLINAPAILAGVRKDVELDVPVVEATLQDGDKGAVVTMVNYTMKPIAKVTLRAKVSRPVQRAVAVSDGKELPVSTNGDTVTLSLPLGMTEFVKLYY